ncbi:MAG: hypothetical protein V3S00_01220 [Dehalococcoidia bacterium]
MVMLIGWLVDALTVILWSGDGPKADRRDRKAKAKARMKKSGAGLRETQRVIEKKAREA